VQLFLFLSIWLVISWSRGETLGPNSEARRRRIGAVDWPDYLLPNSGAIFGLSDFGVLSDFGNSDFGFQVTIPIKNPVTSLN